MILLLNWANFDKNLREQWSNNDRELQVLLAKTFNCLKGLTLALKDLIFSLFVVISATALPKIEII